MTAEHKQIVAFRRRAEDLRAKEREGPRHQEALTQIAENYLQLAKMIEDRTNLPGG